MRIRIQQLKLMRIHAGSGSATLAVPEVGLVLLVGELVERLLAQPEGGVQAVDLEKKRT
jgi:hypothetical protein